MSSSKLKHPPTCRVAIMASSGGTQATHSSASSYRHVASSSAHTLPKNVSSHAAPCPTQRAHRPRNSPLRARRRRNRAAARIAMSTPRTLTKNPRTSLRLSAKKLPCTIALTVLNTCGDYLIALQSLLPIYEIQCASVRVCVCVLTVRMYVWASCEQTWTTTVHLNIRPTKHVITNNTSPLTAAHWAKWNAHVCTSIWWTE